MRRQGWNQASPPAIPFARALRDGYYSHCEVPQGVGGRLLSVRTLVAELSRRRIVGRAVIYVVVAWIVMQAADIIFPALNIPPWALSMVVVLLILGFPVALGVAWMLESPAAPPEGTASRGRDAKARERPEADPDAPRSVAVLPFVNMSDDRDNEYFSDGITEEILNALAKVKDLRVASRTSSFAFKGETKDVLDIADQLRVDTVVEGSVRKAGNRVRVTAQLISADDGYHLWSDTYDGDLEDIFKLQDEIARSIVEALKGELVGEETGSLVVQSTDDVEAYNLYLKGRFFFNRYHQADLERSLHLYREALEHDPAYGRAYAGIADTWMQLADDWMPPAEAYPEAKKAARQALKLDESLAEAHTALGKVLGWFDWDFDAAELALRRAVASNPQYGDAHWGLGSILPPNGQLAEAISEMEEALRIDPLSSSFSYWLARFLLFARHFDRAVEEAQHAINLDPTSFRPLLVLGQGRIARGEAEQGLRALYKAFEVSHVISVKAHIARALAGTGREEEARVLVDELESGDHYVRSEFLAGAYAALGDFDRAFAALRVALQDRSAGLIYLHVDPAYEPLHGDPRFDEIVSEVGLKSG